MGGICYWRNVMEEMTLLDALNHIKENGPVDGVHGICGNCEKIMGVAEFDECYLDFVKMFELWPEFSGRLAFPIHTDKKMSPAEEYSQCVDGWDKSTTYGAARWRLLNFLIEQLEKEE